MPAQELNVVASAARAGTGHAVIPSVLGRPARSFHRFAHDYATAFS